MTGDRGHLGRDPQLVAQLQRLLPPGAAALELSPERTGAVLARIMWSRLTEPGDRVAGALIATLGADTLLSLLAEGRTATYIRDRANAAGVAVAGTAVADNAVAHIAVADAAGAEGLSVRSVSAGLARWKPRLSRAGLLADLERGTAAHMRLLAPGTEAWPTALDDLGEHAPLVLWVRGDPAHLGAPKLAIVGARACSGYGTHITAELASAAGAAGATILSGAAYGIDAVAHRTALAAARPTIAVLAGGADRVYPSAHGALLERIRHTGVVCSELVPGTAPTRWRFLQRNRLIAALARATLVTEAGLRSGSLNTAGHAATLGRPLGAVPGPVTSAASAGCHRLIRDYGATLVTNEDDLRELLDLPRTVAADLAGTDPGQGRAAARQPALHQRVLDALPLRGGRPAGEVARRAGVAPSEALGALAELELLRYVTRREVSDGDEAQWVLLRARD